MKTNHHRQSIRLPGFDYSQPGMYFVTLCVHEKECALGQIMNGKMQYTSEGQLAHDAWEWLQEKFVHVNVDTFCIMPNHTHAIIHILDPHDVDRGDLQIAPTTKHQYKQKPLGRLVGAYKTHSTVQINQHRQTSGMPFWQRNYYEHIIRDETSLTRIREYIIYNPLKWEQDTENLTNC